MKQAPFGSAGFSLICEAGHGRRALSSALENSLAYYPTDRPQKRAVTLVAHGLNVRPAAMLPLVQWLTGHGSDACLVRLSGHHEASVPIREVSGALWKKEMQAGYQRAGSAARRHSVPLYFLGYSLGALLGQSLVADAGAAFDRQILLAPATAIRRRSHLLRLLFFLGKGMKLPSYTPEAYRANEALPLPVYRALFAEERKVAAAAPHLFNLPTLLLVDPKDELISYPKLVRQAKRFPHYRLLVLDATLKGRNSAYHHLILDEPSMGAKNWQRATGEMEQHFFGAG